LKLITAAVREDSPPYLFRADGTPAARPSISYAASGVPWNAKFGVHTPQAASISKVALIRLGSVTHSTEMEQRYIPLSFTRGSGVLTATSPANANIAPPGHYMLVVVNNAGVPSVARMIRVRANVAPRVTLTSPAAGASFASGTPVPLAATASDPDGTINKVEFFDGTTKLGEDTTAPYTLSWPSASPGTHLLKARATDNHSAATTGAGISITVA
jgi:hypothetical protein